MDQKKVIHIKHCWNLIWRMALSQLKVKYSGSMLGISWAILNPVLLMVAIVFVFSIVIKLEIESFPFFALSAIFPWMFFSNAIFEATTSIVHQQHTLHQFNLSRQCIPLATVFSNFLNFLIGWSIVYPLFIFLKPKIIFLTPLLVLIIFLHLIFICGMGLAFSVINVIFRDLSHLLNVLLMLWFWITPIFYSESMIPLKFKWVFYLNPMSYFIVFYREVVFWGNVPPAPIIWGALGWSLGSILLGSFIFVKLNNNVMKRL